MSSIPRLTLNTGAPMPAIGLGCWGGVTEAERAAAEPWILTALKAGYRHLDTAHGYGTEVVVGKAIRASGIPREDIFVTTKLPPHHGGKVEYSINESLERLGLDYVDLYLVHWPQSEAYVDGNDDPKDASGELIVNDPPKFAQVWEQMEKVYASGKARAIGVSNFSVKTLEQLIKSAKVMPAANQLELHPYLQQPALMEYCASKGIKVIAYTPTGYATVRSDPTITSLASKYGVMPAQIILAWHLLRGNAAVPKSANGEHQKGNLVIPKLSQTDFEAICALDREERLCNKADSKGKVYGWNYAQLGW
ncbi:hypothetical protein JAAARDRAFT_82050 [Jaapia argillacea MUCL 33604]|uniref:NADP-dependent oxidoreductase domain-containing protein n=1 Tax=Jaapia argillacea MUCL 33604 TaxID=933084 RepID=A0A067P823_9AGAM|nr:hypothetical protein JAAARDRAFT_82050 [Jaapia argillacea MUCL 33604]